MKKTTREKKRKQFEEQTKTYLIIQNQKGFVAKFICTVSPDAV